MEYQLNPNAKINLFLRIKGLFPNGYHNLYMVMQEIKISDSLTISLEKGESEVVITDSIEGLDPQKNICYKAAVNFLEKAGITDFPRIKISLKKNIPSQAGMGGGSSDGAAVINVLNKHFGYPLNDEQLIEVAVKTGADVPFFIKGKTSVCEGVGEIITPLPSLGGLPVIIVKPQDGVSTPECFRIADCSDYDSDEHKTEIDSFIKLSRDIFEDETISPMERIQKAWDLGVIQNDLEEPAISLLSDIGKIKAGLKEMGLTIVCMTGSGSAVFAILGSLDKGQEIKAELLKKKDFAGCEIYVTEFL